MEDEASSQDVAFIAEDTMQGFTQMGASSWESLANRPHNHPNATNQCRYQTDGNANYLKPFPAQDYRLYQNVSHLPQTHFSAGPQAENNGHKYILSRDPHHIMGQKSPVWSTGATPCDQRYIAAHQNPSSQLWGQSGVVPDHHIHRSKFYQTPPPPYPHKHITASAQSLPSPNLTPWQHLETRYTLQNTTKLNDRNFVQEETQQLAVRHVPQTMDTQANMPVRTRVRLPVSTPVGRPERMPTQKHIPQYSPYSSSHTVPAPNPPQKVCAPIPEACSSGLGSSPFSKPHNRSCSQQQTPTADISQPQTSNALEHLTKTASSCSAPLKFASMPSVSEGSPELSGQLRTTARGPPEPTNPCAGDMGGQTASPVSKQQDHDTPQHFQPEKLSSQEENHSETSFSIRLQSLATRKWTLENLTTLIKNNDPIRMKSAESLVPFKMEFVISTFWKGQRMLIDTLRSGEFQMIMKEASNFCDEHLTVDTVVLSGAKCDLNNGDLLKEGEVYSEPPYSSSWLNINEQLDDIDKECGFERRFLHRCQLSEPLLPTGSVTAEALSPEAEPTSLEGLPRDQKQELQQDQGSEIHSAPSPEAQPTSLEDEQQEAEQEPQQQQRSEMDSTTFFSSTEDPDDVYSFVIEVLPQEQAKAIYDGLHLNEESSAKGDLEGPMDTETSVSKDDSQQEKDMFDTDLEFFFKRWKDSISGSILSEGQHMMQNDLEDAAEEIGWKHLDLSLLTVVEGYPSMDLNQSQNDTPLMEQKDGQEMENYATQDYQVSEKVTQQESMANVFQQKDVRELGDVFQLDDGQELANASQRHGQKLPNVSRREDVQELGNVTLQDGRELENVSQQADGREGANVSQTDDQGSVKVTHQDEQAFSNITQKDKQETEQVFQQDTKTITQKVDNQKTGIVSQQKYVQGMDNASLPISVLPSKVARGAKMTTFRDFCCHGKATSNKLYQGKRPLCLTARCLASIMETCKKSKQSGIRIPCPKKLKTKYLRKDLSKYCKEGLPAKRKLSAELVPFGSAGRKRDFTLLHNVPEVVRVSFKCKSLIKQRIYEEWCRPPIRLGGKSKVKSQRKPYIGLARKETPLPILSFRKDNVRFSLNLHKRRSKLDGPKMDAEPLKQATDSCDEVPWATERPPWDHHLRLVAMGTTGSV